jgi:hypothetical protein
MPGIPPTPPLSRKLFSRIAGSTTPPSAMTAEEKACENEPFYTSVSRLIMQSIPSLELDKVNVTMEAFFATYHIENEDGFSSIQEEDLPEKASEPSNSYWKLVLFRRAVMVIMKGCEEFRVLPSTPYSLFLQYSKNGKTTTNNGTLSTEPEKYKVSTVASVVLEPFSGLTSEYKKWVDDVNNSYGKFRHQEFLTNETLCNTYDKISYSIKCNLSQALSDGTLSFLCEEKKDERSAAKFMQEIKAESDVTADHRTREFKAWWHLFTHSFVDRNDFKSFINKYNQSISVLREAGSQGVKDDTLLRALLIRAIQCEDFESVKTDISKDLDMKPAEILTELKKQHLAMESDEQLNEKKNSYSSSKDEDSPSWIIIHKRLSSSIITKWCQQEVFYPKMAQGLVRCLYSIFMEATESMEIIRK